VLDLIKIKDIQWDSSGRRINPSKGILPDNNKQHLQQTDIHAHSEIRTRNPSKPAAADQHLRLHRHRGSVQTMGVSLLLYVTSLHKSASFFRICAFDKESCNNTRNYSYLLPCV